MVLSQLSWLLYLLVLLAVKFMKFNERGKHVRELQLALMKAGYELPKFGADAHLGDETWEALQDFALDHDFVWAPEIPDSSVQAMLKEMKESEVSQDPIIEIPSYDLRNESFPERVRGRFRIRGSNVVRRVPSAVDGITLHQTAVKYGVNDRQLREANGDERLALSNRFKNTPYHAVSSDGFFSKNYPLVWYTHHGNGLNRKTLGLAVEGLYPGLLDDPDTIEREDLLSLWKGTATTFTDARCKAARAALRYLVEEGKRIGMPIRYLYAHRQSSQTRRSDPGEEIWRKVGIEYGVAVLGLETRPDFVTGTGRAIPDEWSSDGSVPY